MTSEQAALRARIGAYRLHATRDARETTARARESFLQRFEREVDPNGELPEAERQRRAEYARKAHFTRLALRSAQARARRRGGNQSGGQALVTRPTRRRSTATRAAMPVDVQALIREQGVQPIERLEDLAGDFWPPDEDADEFVETIYRWRHEDR